MHAPYFERRKVPLGYTATVIAICAFRIQSSTTVCGTTRCAQRRASDKTAAGGKRACACTPATALECHSRMSRMSRTPDVRSGHIARHPPLHTLELYLKIPLKWAFIAVPLCPTLSSCPDVDVALQTRPITHPILPLLNRFLTLDPCPPSTKQSSSRDHLRWLGQTHTHNEGSPPFHASASPCHRPVHAGVAQDLHHQHLHRSRRDRLYPMRRPESLPARRARYQPRLSSQHGN